MTKKDPNIRAYQAVASMPHDQLAINSSYDAAQMAHVTRANLESEIARQLRDEVITALAHDAGMDSRTFVDFIQFLSEDPELQTRFTGWRAKQRILG